MENESIRPETLPSQEVMDKIQKLLNLAAKSNEGVEGEAANAAAKAAELMLRYNLDVATVERSNTVVDGKREDMKVQGGYYHYQRDLWRAVAEMHFCLYWTQTYAARREKAGYGGKYRTHFYAKGSTVYRKRHALVGRRVNTIAARVLAEYLEAAIETTLRERLRKSDGTVDPAQIFSNWGVSFREGAVDRLISKIYVRRRANERAEDQRMKEAFERAAAAGATTETALTIASYRQSEEDANEDHLHHPGWSAERRARRVAAAEEQRLAEEAYTKWAADNPEEARKQAEEEDKRYRRTRYRGGRADPREARRDYSAYSTGSKAAEKIGLDRPVDSRPVAGRLS